MSLTDFLLNDAAGALYAYADDTTKLMIVGVKQKIYLIKTLKQLNNGLIRIC